MTDWSTVAVACLAALFVCLLVFAVWKANKMDAAPITGDTRVTQTAVTSAEK